MSLNDQAWAAIAAQDGILLNFLDESLEGFSREGWVIWRPLSSQEYLEGLHSWTSNRKDAFVFGELSDAVATAKTWSFFAATSAIQVIRVSQ